MYYMSNDRTLTSPRTAKGLSTPKALIVSSNDGPEDVGIIVYPASGKLLGKEFQNQTDSSTWT